MTMNLRSRSSFLLLLLLPYNIEAQDLSQIPSCAQSPALSSISSTGCKLTDFACYCKDTDFIKSLTPVVEKACSPSDFQKVQTFVQQLCSSVGVTLAPVVAPSPTASVQPAGTPPPTISVKPSGPPYPTSFGAKGTAPTPSGTATGRSANHTMSSAPFSGGANLVGMPVMIGVMVAAILVFFI